MRGEERQSRACEAFLLSMTTHDASAAWQDDCLNKHASSSTAPYTMGPGMAPSPLKIT